MTRMPPTAISPAVAALLVPTYTFATTVGSVTIHTNLYGEITPERVAKARAKSKHRAEQLNPEAPTPRRDTHRGPSRRSYEQDTFDIDEDDDYDEY